jgi:hypothetical protein
LPGRLYLGLPAFGSFRYGAIRNNYRSLTFPIESFWFGAGLFFSSVHPAIWRPWILIAAFILLEGFCDANI